MKDNERIPLRLLLVTWAYFPYIGGVPTHVNEISRRLAADNIDVTVLTTDPSGELATYEETQGVHVRRVRAWPANNDYYYAPGLYPVITRGNWDVVHCQGYQTLVPPLAMFAALRARIPYVLTFHPGGNSSQLRTLIKGFQWKLIRPLIARASHLVVTAEWEKKFFSQRMRLSEQRFTVIPNGGSLPQIEDPFPTNDKGTTIVSVGRLERYKGHHRVIAALPQVLESFPDAQLRIVGSGPYESTLRKLARDLKIADRVEIDAIPTSNRHEMASILSSANLVTLLSEYEGHPMSVTEALALGRPVLTSDHPGLQEFADRGLARSVSLNSTPAQVADAIVEQLRDPLLPSGFELPTWDDCTAKLVDVYRDVVRKSQCAS